MLPDEKSLPVEEDYLVGCAHRGEHLTRVPSDQLVQRLLLRSINSLSAYVNDPDGSIEFLLHAQAYLEQALADVRLGVDDSTFAVYLRFAKAHALEACYD